MILNQEKPEIEDFEEEKKLWWEMKNTSKNFNISRKYWEKYPSF